MTDPAPMQARYVWMIGLVDDGGPYILGDSEDDSFPTIEEAVEDAKAVFDEYEGAEIIQVFKYPGTSYDYLVGGWSTAGGLEVWQ